MLLMSLSTEAAENPKSYFQLKPGEQTQVDAWCFNSKKLSDLRKGVEQCEADRIDLKNQKELNSKLMETQVQQKAIWQEWWVKVPAGIVIGSVLGAVTGEQSKSYVIGGIAGGLGGVATALVLDMEF